MTLVTEFKTAADSVLGAQFLARDNSKRLLIVGAGEVARNLAKAYHAVMPHIDHFEIWARRPSEATKLALKLSDVGIDACAVEDLPSAAGSADIISTATMAKEPILKGDWIKPGTHVDLVGAFKADMREVDDTLISGASLFVDSKETTVSHIGELSIPIAAGIISENDVKGDLYDLVQGQIEGRKSYNEVTGFKNGGGAHLDLMIATLIAAKTCARDKAFAV